MVKKRTKVTAPGDSDPQGPACGGDIVPVPPTSSSGEGRSGVLPTGTPVKHASAEEQRRPEGGTEAKADNATKSAKSGGVGSRPWMARNPERFREKIADLLRDLVVQMHRRADEVEDVSAYLERLVEEMSARMASHFQEPVHLVMDLRKEVEELRVECAGLRAAAQVPASPVAPRMEVGVQTTLPPTKESVGVGGGMPPPTRRDEGSQTPVDGGVGAGGGVLSLDSVAALIDAKVGALRDDIVAEVRRGVAGVARPPPVREEEAYPSLPASGSPGPARPSQDGVPWTRVLGRRERRKKKEGVVRPAPRPLLPAGGASGGGADEGRKAAERRPRLPRIPGMAAIVVAPVGESKEEDVEGAVDLAMGEITREDSGTPGVQLRRTFTGGLLLQILGEDGSAKADSLAARIRGVLADKGIGGVRVDRPVKLADLRVTGLVGPTAANKVARALADVGCCDVGEVRVGAIRRAPRGLGSAWVRLPAAAARRAVEAGTIKVGGWVPVGVEPIDTGPMRCYRCLRVGHAGRRCTAKEDRGGRCFRCSEPGHLAKACAAPTIRCPLCADLGRRSDHRLGAAACLRPPSGGAGDGGQPRDGGGVPAPAPVAAQRGEGSGGDTSPPPEVGDGGVPVAPVELPLWTPENRGTDMLRALQALEKEASAVGSSAVGVDMDVSPPLPQREQREDRRGAKRPAEEEEGLGLPGENAGETGKEKGGVAREVPPPKRPGGRGSGGAKLPAPPPGWPPGWTGWVTPLVRPPARPPRLLEGAGPVGARTGPR